MEYKLVCKLLKTHGLKGEVKVYLTTTEVEKRFKRGSVLYILLDDSSYKKVTVNTFKYIEGNLAFVTFKEFKDINEIEPYLKKEVYGEKLVLKYKIYYSDLVGSKVIYNSSYIGEIKEVQRIANKEYILINSSLIPFIKDVFYKNLNDEERTIELTEQGKDVLDNA